MTTKNTTLHERSSKSFNRTPNGLIFSDNLKTVYSVLLLCLDLKEDNGESKTLFGSFHKSYPYSFSVQDAVEKMKHLELLVDKSTTSISMSYSIKYDLANYLLKVFMAAKLLHSPADRTRYEPKAKVLLQPTPKGVAILQKYVRDIGLKTIPKILLSSLNSMQLFSFERSSATDSIVHSDYLIHILFIKIMGLVPNVWSALNPDDNLPVLSKLLEYSNESFSFEDMQYDAINGFDIHSLEGPTALTWSNQLSGINLEDTKRVSPLGHKFFTNPDSDSHIQYYVSDKGVRLFKSKIFGSHKTMIDYCFTTKALWQWLMDCTDIIHPKEAVSIAALILKEGLVVPILLPPSENSKRKFHISRTSYYTLSKIGWEVIQWNSEVGIKKALSKFKKVEVATPDCNQINVKFGQILVADDRRSLHSILDADSSTDVDVEGNSFDAQLPNGMSDLTDVLRDPGMRYLFRRFLENELCSENLDAYIETRKFLNKMTVLKNLIDSKYSNQTRKGFKSKASNNNIIATIDSALTKQANECLELTYNIYSSYVMIGAPYQINIDHKLRESITAIMLHPQSPISKPFSLDFGGDENPRIRDDPTSITRPQLNDFALSEPEATVFRSTLMSNMIRTPFRDIKPKSLNLEIEPAEKQLTGFNDNSFLIPEDDELTTTLNILKKLYTPYENIGNDMYKLMKSDSFQKFINSGVYLEALNMPNFQERN